MGGAKNTRLYALYIIGMLHSPKVVHSTVEEVFLGDNG